MKKFTSLFMLILMVAWFAPKSGNSQNLQTDSLALVALYNACGGENWTGFDKWMTSPIRQWENITITNVDGVDRVTNIAFVKMTLTGTMPDEMGNLTEFKGRFDLHNQAGLTGALPAWIWKLTKVERIQVKFCGFSSIDVTGIESMVNLYEFNTQGTPFEGEVPVEIFKLPKMRDVYLEDGKWSSLPADMPIPTPTPLRRFYINGNQFTDLPDLTGMVWASGANVKIRNNYLTFEDIEPNMWIKSDANVSTFEYSPQETIGEDMIVYANAGSVATLQSNIEETASTVYTWIKGADEVVGDTKDLVLSSFDPATQSGSYYCLAQSSLVPGLDIMTAKKMLYENATAQDSMALVALYNACGGENWTGFDKWMTSPIRQWENITITNVDGVDRVTNIAFVKMTLTGTMPDEMGNLTEFKGRFDLHNQAGLTGALPAWIWKLTKVERIQVKFCGFSSIDVTGIENMVNLYEFNTQGTPFEGEVPVEIFKLPKMRDVYLEDGKWSSLPADMPIPTPTPLKRFYINGNQFTKLPDFTGMVWDAAGTKIKVYGNQLTFEDIEPNMWIASDANVSAFEYSPQALLTGKDTISLTEGEMLKLSVKCGGSQNAYVWLKDGEIIDGAESDSLVIASVLKGDTGEYQCMVQNPLVPGLDLASDTFSVVVNYPVSANLVEKSSFRINGNPVKDMLSIDSDNSVDKLVIIDIAGRTLRNMNINSSTIRVNVSDLKTGIYFVSLQSGQSKRTLKIIKE